MRDFGGHTPRGAWRFLVWSPPHLAGVVDHVWSYTGPTADTGKRVFPNGKVELLVNLAEPYREVGRGALPAAWISGHRAAPVVLSQPAYQQVVAARLHPAGAYALLGCPLREVTELAVELEDLVGKPIIASDSALYWRLFKTRGLAPSGRHGRLLSTLS